MKSHELAKQLLTMPDREIIGSIDLSSCETDAYNRAFSDNLIEAQVNNEHTLSLIFERGWVNYE